MNEENLPRKDTPFKVKPKNKAYLIKLVSVAIILLGSIVFFIDRFFTDFDSSSTINAVEPITAEVTKSSLKGTIKYTSPANYPGENISYKLVDKDGKDVILLKSEDAKLEMAENLRVEVQGLQTKTKAGESVLIVEKIIISN